jgi:hypothetical protein
MCEWDNLLTPPPPQKDTQDNLRTCSMISMPYRLTMEVDLQSLLGSMSRDLHICTHWLRARNSSPPPAFGLVLRGRYWSAKIDDISLNPPDKYPCGGPT